MSRLTTLAGQQVAELAARCAEGGRLSRGRTLYRKGSVSELTVAVGSVSATVRGSQGTHYTSTVATSIAPPGVHRQVAEAGANGIAIDDLIDDDVAVCPRDGDLVFDCECADFDEPCKHVLAVLLALADRVDLDVDDLLRWRGLEPVEPSTSSPTQGDGRQTELAKLEALLGDTALRPNRRRSKPRTTETETETETEPPALAPELAEFFGVGLSIEGPDLTDLEPLTPLFEQTQVGPLADLGPELAQALAAIAGMLAEP